MVQWCRGVVVAGLAAVVGMVQSLPASADTATWSDQTGEVAGSSAIHILSHGVALDASGLTLTIRFATVDWAVVDQTPILVFLDVPGDTQYMLQKGSSDNWTTLRENPWPPGGVSNLCYDLHRTPSAEALVLSVPASCIDSPTQVSWRILVDNGYGDVVPSLSHFTPWVGNGPQSGPTAPRAPVFRFWSPGFDNAHFYSTNESEINAVFADPNWRSEGATFSAIAFGSTGCPDGSPVFRFWSDRFRSHFYTQSVAERDHLISSDPAWHYERVAYCAYPDARPGTTPLYRFWSPVFGKHFFTADPGEAHQIRTTDRNWTFEGTAYHVLP